MMRSDGALSGCAPASMAARSRRANAADDGRRGGFAHVAVLLVRLAEPVAQAAARRRRARDRVTDTEPDHRRRRRAARSRSSSPCPARGDGSRSSREARGRGGLVERRGPRRQPAADVGRHQPDGARRRLVHGRSRSRASRAPARRSRRSFAAGDVEKGAGRVRGVVREQPQDRLRHSPRAGRRGPSAPATSRAPRGPARRRWRAARCRCARRARR